MSYPLDFVPGSTKYQSQINRCCHGVFRPFGDPQGTSSCCDVCNTSKLCRPSKTPLKKAIRKNKTVVPPLEEVFKEV
jgi:hypothetical protein